MGGKQHRGDKSTKKITKRKKKGSDSSVPLSSTTSTRTASETPCPGSTSPRMRATLSLHRSRSLDSRPKPELNYDCRSHSLSLIESLTLRSLHWELEKNSVSFSLSSEEERMKKSCVSESPTTSEQMRSLTGSNASGWKFQDNFYGNFNVGRRPSMAVAWGRRVYDQYEIEIASNKTHTKYLDTTSKKENKINPRDVGAWDLIFNPSAVSHLDSVHLWDPYHEERARAMRRLKLDSEMLRSKVVDDEQDGRVSEFRKHFMRTGDYLRPQDMKFCVDKTHFSEDEIIEWFKRFKHDCPQGKLTRDHLRKLFRVAFPDGNADRFSRYVMWLFDSDGNDYLDFKEFLLAINMAKCETEESKLSSLFKLYDTNNTGYVDCKDLKHMIGTLQALTNDNDDDNDYEKTQLMLVFNARRMTEAQFLKGYKERNDILNKLDAQEQETLNKALVFKSTDIVDTKDNKLESQMVNILYKKLGIDLDLDAFQEIQLLPTQKQYNVARVRFSSKAVRDAVLGRRSSSATQSLRIEEWLTNKRLRLYRRCQELKLQGFIENVTTRMGDIVVHLKTTNSAEQEVSVILNDSEYDELVKRVKCLVNTSKEDNYTQ